MNCGERSIQPQPSARVPRVSHNRCCYSLTATAVLFAGLRCFAQEAPPAPHPATQDPSQQTAPAEKIVVVVPAGTRIPLVLQRPISTKTTRPGDMAYLLTTAPVIAGDKMVIPPETFVQGEIARITIPGIDSDGALQIHSAHMVFANGYTVAIPYDFVVLLPRQWISPEAPGPGKALGLTAALAAPAVGALIGGLTSMHKPPPLTPPVIGQPLTLPDLGNPVKGAAIGASIGFGVTIPVTIALLRHHQDFFVEAGSPTEMILEQPLMLDPDRIAAAIPLPGTVAVAFPRRPPALRTCYTPDVPGTPDVVTPGTPTIPGRAYPCP